MSKLRQAAEELSRAWRGMSLSELIAAVHKMDAALAEDRLAEYMPPKRDERRTFSDWWNYGEVSPGNNPYRHESAAYWAWEGWQAGVKAEREACVQMCDEARAPRLAEKIRARGQDE